MVSLQQGAQEHMPNTLQVLPGARLPFASPSPNPPLHASLPAGDLRGADDDYKAAHKGAPGEEEKRKAFEFRK